jgi:TonB-dependent receptor
LGEFQTPVPDNAFDLIFATRQNGTVSENNVLLAGLAGLAYKTGKSKFKLTGMHLQNGETRSTSLFIENSEDAPGQSGFTGDSYNLEYSERGITNVLLNGYTYFDKSRWEIDWRGSSTFSTIDDPDLRRTTFTRSVSGGASRFNAGAGGFPSRLSRFLDEVNLVGRVNVTKEYQLLGETAEFKFGGSHVYKQRDFEILTFGLQFFGNQPEFNGDPNEVLRNNNIFGNGNGGTVYFQSRNADPNPNAYNSNSRNTAFYVSNEFTPFAKLKANIGLRAENFVLRHTGRDIRFAQGGEGNNLDNEKVLDALDFFPSANLTYFLTDNINVRASYSRTIARPSFKELSFAQILDPVSDRIFNGGLFAIGSWDGNLRETRINNFDLRWEMFFDRGQLLSASFFYKTFDDPIELVRIRAQQTSSEFQPRNVGNAEVFGAEFEIRKSLDFISSSLTNFGFNGNITLVQSITDITDEELQARLNRQKEGQNVEDTRELAGQAPLLINAGFTYSSPQAGLDGGLFYNVRGETLIRVGGGIFPDVFSEPFHSLNFNLNKSLGQASLSFSVDNILNDTNEELYQSFRSDEEVFNSFNPGRSVSLGVKYSF